MSLLSPLKSIWLCLDSLALLKWLAGHPRLKWLASHVLRLRCSPTILQKINDAPLSLEAKGALFSEAVSYFSIGGTCKTTGVMRTNLVDAAILDFLKSLECRKTLLEVGASDGSASLNLLEKVPEGTQVILTDRFPGIFMQPFMLGKRFCDTEMNMVGVKMLWLLVRKNGAVERDDSWQYLDMANPLLREYGVSSINAFNLFSGRLAEPVSVIKCANILNPCYFDEETILRGVDNLLANLVDGGRLYISHNNKQYEDGEAYVVIEKRTGKPALVESRNDLALMGILKDHLG